MNTHDAFRETRRERAAFERVRNAERQFAVQLRKIAGHIDTIVRSYSPDHPAAVREMLDVLRKYSDMLRPWSNAVVRRLLAEVNRRDEKAWNSYARLMGVEIKKQLTTAPVGLVYNQLMAEQVHLITSLPLEAAQRVHDLVSGNLYVGARAAEVSEQIMQTGLVTKARANLIARTETGRAASAFAQARAQHIGSEGYIWRSARDKRTRPLHRRLEGTFHRWAEPPIAGENGERAHPGAIYNCRCFPEPTLPDYY